MNRCLSFGGQFVIEVDGVWITPVHTEEISEYKYQYIPCRGPFVAYTLDAGRKWFDVSLKADIRQVSQRLLFGRSIVKKIADNYGSWSFRACSATELKLAFQDKNAALLFKLTVS